MIHVYRSMDTKIPRKKYQEELCMSDELLVTRKDNIIFTIRTENSRIVQIQAEDADTRSVLGNIYVGKVRNIVKNINAAFVEFQKGQMGYFPLSREQCPVHTDGVHFQEGRVLAGDEIIVQVGREAVHPKPPTLTSRLNLPGRYVVLVSEGGRISVSSKISDKDTRKKLAVLLERYVTQDYGLIARTNSAGADMEEVACEIEILVKRYKEIITYGRHKAAFSCLYSAPPVYLSSIINSYDDRLEKIITDDKEIYNSIRAFTEGKKGPGAKLVLWEESQGKLDAVYGISKTAERALMPKVWLKSGAYIIIQPTEALVAIDVNTGKAISKKKDVQKTFFKVNMEAAAEIAVQLRLRNLSGMILVDFIDMEDERNNQLLMEFFKSELAKDSIRTKLVDMTKLGLVEVTRKKTRKPLYMQLNITS